MRLLVLGGTVFLGHTIAALARDRGHDVTCLARGDSGVVPTGVSHVCADRSGPGAYDAVAGDEWDAVVDVCHQPGWVREAVAALGPHARHWTYVSSCSVYATQDTPGADELVALNDPLPLDTTDASPEQYASAKAACERVCSEALADRLHVCRPGLIVGSGDASDRAGYWPGRFQRGGEVLVPAADRPAQLLDVRDLAGFLLDVAEGGAALVANAVGEQVGLQQVLRTAREVAGGRGDPVPVDDEWLLEQEVAPFMGDESLPLWIPLPAWTGFMARSDARAVAAGLSRRPLAETLAAALDHERALGLERSPRRAGLSPAREASLLAAWRARG